MEGIESDFGGSIYVGVSAMQSTYCLMFSTVAWATLRMEEANVLQVATNRGRHVVQVGELCPNL